jgi:hypothetical protein
MKILSIAIGLALALSLAAGAVLPGLAAPEVASPAADDFQSNGEPPAWGRLLPNMLRGEVTSIDEGKAFFTIKSQEDEVTISVNDDTQYFIAPVPQKLAALARNRLELSQEGENQGECQNLELRQQLRNSAQWQVKPQERKRLEGPVSIKLMPMPTDTITKEKAEPEEPIAIELTPVNKTTVVAKDISRKPIPVDSANTEGKETGKTWSEKLKWLHRFGTDATFDDITVGAKVLVVTAPEEDNHLAKWVLIIKPAASQPVVGTVAGISTADKTVTIAPTDGGEAIPVKYNERTRSILRGTPQLEVGQSVRAVCDEEMIARVILSPVEAVEPTDEN